MDFERPFHFHNLFMARFRDVASEVPLQSHWSDIHLRRWLIVAIMAAAAVFAYAISLLITPVYEARTTFFLASNSESPHYVGGPEAPPEPLFPTPDEKTAALNVGILRGGAFMQGLADEFGLPAALLRKRVDVTVSGEFMVDLFVRSEDAGLAARIAARAPGLYAEFHEASMRKRAADVASTLTAHIDGLEEELAALVARTEDQRRRFGSAVDDALVKRLSDRRASAEQRLLEIDGALSAAEARRAELEAELAAERQTYAAGGTVLTTPVLDLMVEQLLVLRVELAAVREGPQSSSRRTAILEQITEIETAIEAERARMAEATVKSTGTNYEILRADIAKARAEEAALTASRVTAETQMSAADADLEAAIASLGEAERLAARRAEIEAQITDARINLASATLQAANARAPLMVVEEASLPTRPAFPIPVLNAIVAALAGAIAGFYYALFVGHAARARMKKLADTLQPPRFTDAELQHLRRIVQAPKAA